MKTIRNLSGIYFRSQNTETKKWENVVFEDLSIEEQDKILDGYDVKTLKRMCKILANTINKLGDTFDLVVGEEESDTEE